MFCLSKVYLGIMLLGPCVYVVSHIYSGDPAAETAEKKETRGQSRHQNNYTSNQKKKVDQNRERERTNARP